MPGLLAPAAHLSRMTGGRGRDLKSEVLELERNSKPPLP